MITDIRIQNYKLFKSFELAGLSKILLVGGKNSCGKTSLLEAVFFPLDHFSPAMFLKLLNWRGIDSIDLNFSFESSYHNFNVEKPMVFEYTANSSKRKWQYKFLPPAAAPLDIRGGIVNLPKNPPGNAGRIEISLWSDGKMKRAVFLQPGPDGLQLTGKGQWSGHNNLRAAFLAPAALSPPEENARRYGELDKINKAGGILASLKILEPKLKSLSVIPLGGKPALYGDIGMGKKIPLRLMGQGMERLASILLAISEVKKGLALVDELENGFHYSSLESVWRAIAGHAKNNGAQIIATTHSRELAAAALGGIPQDLRSDFKYMRIERGGEGFKAKMYDFETLNAAVDSNLEVR